MKRFWHVKLLFILSNSKKQRFFHVAKKTYKFYARKRRVKEFLECQRCFFFFKNLNKNLLMSSIQTRRAINILSACTSIYNENEKRKANGIERIMCAKIETFRRETAERRA